MSNEDKSLNSDIIYLDNSATTRTLPQAVSACVLAMESEYGNPSSLHRMGFEAEMLVERAKASLAAALTCESRELYFTSGATEANNIAIFGAAKAGGRRWGGKKIVTTAIEHPSVLAPLDELEKQGYTVERLLPIDGVYTPKQFYDAVDEDTVLVCAMWVNNETGLILPILEIGKEVKRKNPNVIFHVDGVQGFLKLPLPTKLKGSPIDIFTVSGHKVSAPKGIGALFVRRELRIPPLLFGGGQQNGLRPGTEPVPLIAAFGEAVAVLSKTVDRVFLQYRELKEYLLSQLREIPQVLCAEEANGGSFSPQILSLSVKGLRSEVLLHFLETKSIFVSSGSACAKGKQSHVLAAMGMPKEVSDSTIRISFGSDTTREMLQSFAEALKEAINTLAKSY